VPDSEVTMQSSAASRCSALIALLGLVLIPAAPAFGHGEVDEDMLAEFHLHLDDYREDVDHLIEELDPILEAHAAGRDTEAAMAELIEHWEEVAVHAAIETRATVTYPTVWQAIIGLQQTASGGADAEAVRAAAERVKAALWQAYGAVRLAASQVGRTAAAAPSDQPPASGPETIQRIVEDLEAAVAAYRADDLARAEGLIHDTYMNRFEGLEGDLIARDPDLVSSLEKDFNATLPLLMQQGASLDRIDEALAAMRAQLDEAGAILKDVEQSRSEVF
jgi:hypothetical protein